MCSGPWNSLEVAKLLVNLTLPVVLLLLGLWVFQVQKKIESGIERINFGNEWKKNLYDDISHELNIIFCAFNYVGRWKTFTPERIIESKRILDEKIYSYKLLFSNETLERYEMLMKACFETQRGKGKGLLIKANVVRYIEDSEVWRQEYLENFVEEENRLRRVDFNKNFDDLQYCLFKDVGFLN